MEKASFGSAALMGTDCLKQRQRSGSRMAIEPAEGIGGVVTDGFGKDLDDKRAIQPIQSGSRGLVRQLMVDTQPR